MRIDNPAKRSRPIDRKQTYLIINDLHNRHIAICIILIPQCGIAHFSHHSDTARMAPRKSLFAYEQLRMDEAYDSNVKPFLKRDVIKLMTCSMLILQCIDMSNGESRNGLRDNLWRDAA
ncbi:hypothetical protein GCK32_020433, partial [Trichostrongylus colubriformis]